MSTKIVEGEGGRLLQLDSDSHEPVSGRAAVVAAVGAALVLAAQLGLDLPEQVQTSITTLAVLAAPAVAAWWARRRAWSGASVAEVLDRQLDQVTKP